MTELSAIHLFHGAKLYHAYYPMYYFLKHWHRLPEREAMVRNIEEMKRWKRSGMPPIPTRRAAIGPHQLHYHDELLRDFWGESETQVWAVCTIDGVDRTLRIAGLR